MSTSQFIVNLSDPHCSQPHSSLNRFKRANDRKSHLILNLLSWVDFLQPKYCFFENVKGFLKYSLNASQDGQHKVKGGIEMGGLKFLVHALLAMRRVSFLRFVDAERVLTRRHRYQVRFALLQAGHYGTPQGRVRFFLIAAKQGHPLPPFPQPTHSSLLSENLHMNVAEGLSVRPILTAHGVAPHRHVTIEDAISDLPPFDWCAAPPSSLSPAPPRLR